MGEVSCSSAPRCAARKPPEQRRLVVRSATWCRILLLLTGRLGAGATGSKPRSETHARSRATRLGRTRKARLGSLHLTAAGVLPVEEGAAGHSSEKKKLVELSSGAAVWKSAVARRGKTEQQNSSDCAVPTAGPLALARER